MGSRPAAGLSRPWHGAAAAAAVAVLASCTDTPASCRGEVAAAFERLRTSGRPYRKETTIDRQAYRRVAEFIPPDRMREVTSDRTGTSELIRVGARAWDNQGGADWHEWEPRLVKEIYRAGMDVSLLPDRVLPASAAFECLGIVEFKDNGYVGYRTKLAKSIAYVAPTDPMKREEPAAKVQQELRQMPQEWRTVLVDRGSGLPVYDLVAGEDQLDKPRYELHFTYPTDIRIDQPFR